MKRLSFLPLLLLLVAGAVAAPGAEAADWPQWGGPLRNGESPATGVFGAGPFELREVWRQPAGQGIAALVVVGERVFSTAAVDGQEFTFALEAATGKELWRVPLGASHPSLEWGPVSTPASDGKLLFVLSSGCRLLALAVADGRAVWQHELKAEFKANDGAIGCWTSPLLEGARLIVQVNGEPDKRVMGFDAASGAVLWSTGEVQSWARRSSPAVADLGGVRQALVHDSQQNQGGLYGLRPEDGSLLWSIRFPESESWSGDLPVPLGEDRVGVLTWNDLRVLQIDRQSGAFSARPLWRDPAIRAGQLPSTWHLVADGGHLYGFGGERLSCFDAVTGKLAWTEKIYPGSLILVDGHLLVLSRAAGLLRVVEATPTGFREVARREVFNPGAPTDAPPSFAGRRIYLRNSEEMVALEVVAKTDQGRGSALH